MNLSPSKRACAFGLTAITLVAGLGLSATPAFAAAPGSSFGAAAHTDTEADDTGDIGALELISEGTFPTGKKPWGIAVSSDGRYVYAANQGAQSVTYKDMQTGVVRSFATNTTVYSVAASPNGRYVYAAGGNQVTVFDQQENTTSSINDFTGWRGFRVSPDGRKLVATWGSTVYVHDLHTHTTTTFGVGSGASITDASFSPDGRYLYLSDYLENNLIIRDFETNTTRTVSNGQDAYAVAASPDGKYVYIGLEHEKVNVYDVAAGKIVGSFGVGKWGFSIAVSADSRFVYVANNGSNTITVRDTQTNTTKTISAGLSGPHSIVAASDGGVYVTNENNDTVSEFTEDQLATEAPVDVTSPVAGSTVGASKPVFSGTGEADSSIVVTDAAGTTIATATVGTDGNWSATSTVDLPNGAQTVTVTQTSPTGKTTTDTVSFTIDTTAPAPFDVTVTGNVVSGKGVDGATINILDKNGNNVGTTTVTSGAWSIPVTKFGTGKQPITVTQTVAGQTSTPVAAEIDFGASAALVLTKPLDGSTVIAPDNKVDFAGTGEPGAKIVIKNGIGREVVNTTVGTDGKWAQTGMLGFQWYELKTEYTPQGEATVIGKTTVTVKASAGVTQPFSVTAPTDNSTVIAPDNMVTFSGKGTTGATIVIKNQVNREVINVKVDEFGNWSAKGFLGFQWYELDTFNTVGGTTETGKLHVTVKAAAGVTQPFSLDTPADNATVVAPDNMVTFSGKGTTGAAVVLKAQNGREVINTVVDDKGNWSAKGGLGFQYYELDSIYTAPGQAAVNGKTHLTVSSGKVINPFQMTSPKDGDTVVTPSGAVTFTGTGAAGAKVEIINDLGGAFERVVASTTVKDDGTYTMTGYLNPNLTYPLWYKHTPGVDGGTAANGTFTITTTPTK